uniref:F-box domain-containing protein n=1 Tax=viral metagenome TaxID=1070528 RepID=A0A6C0CZD1_9ZZZZ
MHINRLSDDLLLLVWSYLHSNMDMLSVITTCKYYKEIGYKYGFLKHIKISRILNYQDFILNCYKHQNSLLSISLQLIDIPHSLIYTKWPLKVVFYNCYMGNISIDPLGEVCNTQELHIIDYYRNTRNTPININWNKFINLKRLNIYASDIQITDFDKCKNLEDVAIDLSNRKFSLPNTVCQIKNLKTLLLSGSITTNSNTTNMYFISDKLNFCSINNKCDIINGQNKLLINHKINIQCFTYIFN